MLETLDPIQVPDFARELLEKQKCPQCAHRFIATEVEAAGVRYSKDRKTYFYYEVRCSGCGEPSMTVVTSRMLSPIYWARQIVVWMGSGSTTRFLAELPENPMTLLKAQPNPACGLPMPVHGGYQALDDGSVMLLVRQHAPFTTEPHRDCLCLVQPHSRLRFSRLKDHECILDDDWPQFLAARDGHEFKIGKRVWRKLARPEIEAVVKDRHFRDSSKVRHRPKSK